MPFGKAASIVASIACETVRDRPLDEALQTHYYTDERKNDGT